MKTTTIKLALHRWPYGLELHPSRDGWVLRPRRKARVNWAKAFRRLSPPSDDLSAIRRFPNELDRQEWEW